MTNSFLKSQLLRLIRMTAAPDEKTAAAVRARLNDLGKPIGSFGQLEQMITRMAAVKGQNVTASGKKALVILCGDHGVVAEGVSQTGSEVTRIVAENIAAGRGAAALLAERCHADVYVIDLGMQGPAYAGDALETGSVINRRIGSGSGNIAVEPAMTEDDCLRAILQGIAVAGELAAADYQMIGLGEMGIGNTTPSSALAAVLMDLPADEVTGRGAGLSYAAWQHKIAVVEKAVSHYWDAAAEIEDGPDFKAEVGIELLAQLGSYEIAGLCGMCIGSAVYAVPMMLDGLITLVAAMAASLICPECKAALFASHFPEEPACRRILKMLRLDPVIDAGMRQGEGCGALMAMQLLDDMLLLYDRLPSFDDIRVTPYTDYEGIEKI